MSRILFSLACTAIISISINFVKIIFKKFISLTQTAPARVSFAFHSVKSHVPYNYRSRKSCAVAVRRKQKRPWLKPRKRRNWLGLAGVAPPRRMRRSMTSLNHPTETSNKVRAFHLILVRPLETGVVGHKSYILLFSYSSIFRVQMKFYCFWALNVLWACSKAQKTSPAAGGKYRLFYHADYSWETVEKFPLLLTWCALQNKVFIKTDSQ